MSTPLPCDYASIEDFFAPSGPKPLEEVDTRSYPRFFYRACAEIKLHPSGNQKGESSRTFVLTQDLSRSGCNIIYSRPLKPGQRLDGRPDHLAEVAWCRPLADRHYAVGCRFISRGPAEE